MLGCQSHRPQCCPCLVWFYEYTSNTMENQYASNNNTIEDLGTSPLFTPTSLRFSWRCKFSTYTINQPMIGLVVPPYFLMASTLSSISTLCRKKIHLAVEPVMRLLLSSVVTVSLPSPSHLSPQNRRCWCAPWWMPLAVAITLPRESPRRFTRTAQFTPCY